MGKITNVLWLADCGGDTRRDVIGRNRAWPSVTFFYPSDIATVTATGRNRERAGADHNHGESIEILVQAQSALWRVG
jgi:hypothetical protein